MSAMPLKATKLLCDSKMTLWAKLRHKQCSKPFHHSITSSAVASSVGEIVTPSAFAAFRLITRSNLVGCWIGRSPGLAPFTIDIIRRTTEQVSDVGAIGHQPAARGEQGDAIDCRHAVSGGDGDDGIAMGEGEDAGQNQHTAALFARDPRHRGLDFGIVIHPHTPHRQREGLGRFLAGAKHQVRIARCRGIKRRAPRVE
jgi:hypothetical protein